MEQLVNKKELIEWLTALENDVILAKIVELKNKQSFDFQDNFINDQTLEEFRTEIEKQIDTFR